MNPKDFAAKMGREMSAATDKAFDYWLHSPAVALIISLLPPSPHPDALQALLRDCFNSGASLGRDVTLSALLSTFKGVRDERQEGS